MTYTINYDSAMMGSNYVTINGEVKKHLSDDCVFDDKEEAISIAKLFRAASAIVGDTVTVYTLEENAKEVFCCEVPAEEEGKWIVSYRYDGSEEGEVDLDTENEWDAREYFKNVCKDSPSWSNTADRTYDKRTQLTYSYTEWTLSRYDTASEDYEGINTVVTLRIYDTLDDYIANVCEEDREEAIENYKNGVEYLRRLTNADNVVFGNC